MSSWDATEKEKGLLGAHQNWIVSMLLLAKEQKLVGTEKQKKATTTLTLFHGFAFTTRFSLSFRFHWIRKKTKVKYVWKELSYRRAMIS